MRFWLRWAANSVAVFLALYLVDSLLHERFRFTATWAAVIAAIVLAFVDSFVKPLHRARSKPGRAALAAALNVLVDALILQLFVWVGAGLTTLGFLWVLLAAAFATLVAGLINSQVGFTASGKRRPGSGGRERAGSGREGRRQATDEPKPVRTERKRLT